MDIDELDNLLSENCEESEEIVDEESEESSDSDAEATTYSDFKALKVKGFSILKDCYKYTKINVSGLNKKGQKIMSE